MSAVDVVGVFLDGMWIAMRACFIVIVPFMGLTALALTVKESRRDYRKARAIEQARADRESLR